MQLQKSKSCQQVSVNLKHSLYLRLVSKIQAHLGRQSSELKSYQARYRRQIVRQEWVLSHRDELLDSLERADLVFFADFHALKQSQKGHLRILKSLSKQRQRILAIEFVESEFQVQLDLFMQNLISEADFLRKIGWEKNWGFAWENYKPILLWAQRNQVQVYAINQFAKKAVPQSLRSRDEFSAKQILALRQRHPQAQILVIYGEMHLARGHLPKIVNRNFRAKKVMANKTIIVHQNQDHLYFFVERLGQVAHIDVIRSKVGEFCVLNVPPWVKWQCYLDHLHQEVDGQGVEKEVDLTETVAQYIQFLSKELGVAVNPQAFSVFYKFEASIFAMIDSLQSASQEKMVRDFLQMGLAVYLPEKQTGILAKDRENHLQMMAMAILHAQAAQQTSFAWKIEQSLQVHIWNSAIEYFGAKIVNPKIKSDTFEDLREMSVRHQGGEAARLAFQYRLQELALLRTLQRKKTLTPIELSLGVKKSTYYKMSKILGAMLGEKIFFAYDRKLFSRQFIQKILKKNTQHASFAIFYYEMLEMLDAIPEPFRSKAERL